MRMYEINSQAYEQYLSDQELPRVRRLLYRALLKRRTVQEVIAEFDLSFEDEWDRRVLIIKELQFREYNARDLNDLRQLVHTMITQYETLPTKQKRKADSALKRLLPLLPTEERKRIGLKLITHSRMSHRYVGYSSLTGIVDQEIIIALLQEFSNNSDSGALECIARSENQFLVSNHAKYILDNLQEDYGKGRIFEKLIHESPNYAIQLSPKHQFAFVLGVGRARARKMLNNVLDILSHNRKNYDLLGIIVWALDRLDAVDEMEALSRELANNDAQ